MLLKIEGLDVAYGDIQVIWNLNLEVKEKELVALVGANGAGKSTLLNTISGLLPTKKGKILLRGIDISKMSPSQRVKEMRILQVPEGRKLFSGMTVNENLLMGAFLREDRDQVKKDLEWVYSLFPEMTNKSNNYAGNLSGGEQQMVAIGRALMGDPQLLLIDELSLGLAPIVVDRLVKAIEVIRNTGKMSIVMVEQDVHLGFQISDRGYVIETGIIRKEGNSKELLDDDSIKTAYLGL
ncbi:MAG TPA: ABC transporter ATP-binding protein [Clostridia bacterium]|nr:ABC transporter ATP-binding protein [Clostridia bacterium]